MQYDFDKIHSRQNTGAMKWDVYQGRDIIPMWVADMDFRSPPQVISAMRERVDHGMFGYTWATDELNQVIVEQCERRYGWEIDASWLVWTPGLGAALTTCCRAVGENDDEVIVQRPIYSPFLRAAEFSHRKMIAEPMVLQNDHWEMDFDSFENRLTPRTKLFLFCNPHNPVGKVYSREDLEWLAEICVSKNLVVCADEVHCDLILDQDKRHIPFASLNEKIADQTITLMAASKTYNLAGLYCGFAIIKNSDLRNRFKQAMEGIVSGISPVSFVGTLAAYRDSEDWRLALLDYLRQNRALVEQRIKAMPKVSMTHVEASYLAWINAQPLGVDNPVSFFEAAGVGLLNGAGFGGPGYVRLNFGCPRSQLAAALDRMEQALS